jgi:hypothetical protein
MGVIVVAKRLKGTCPCGFSFITPHGEDDAINVIQYHVKLIHNKEYPNGLTRAQALDDIEEIK